MAETKEKLIVSKERVKDHGEVYTPKKTVEEMCDMEGVKDCTYDLTSTILEPACGDGNFLVELVARKMDAATRVTEFDRILDSYETCVLKAVSLIYGVDILPDNIEESRKRMREVVAEKYSKHTGHNMTEDFEACVAKIIELNTIWGNTLTTSAFKTDEDNIKKATAEETAEEKPKKRKKAEA